MPEVPVFSYLLMLYAFDVITGGGTIRLEAKVVRADGSVSVAGLSLALYVGSGLQVLRTCGFGMYFRWSLVGRYLLVIGSLGGIG